MSAFQPVRLDDCCDIISGATPKTGTKAYWDGDIFWATPKDLSTLEGPYIDRTPRSITRAGLQSCSATVLPERSVLFSSRAPIGHVAINRVPMATNQGFKSLVPKAGRVHPEYLFHWLRSNRSYLESLGNGATFKEVSKAVVSRVEIPLPPLPEQRRIADILDKADSLRAQRRAAFAELDALSQSIFMDLFGDPAPNPRGWPVSTIADIAIQVTDGEHLTPKRTKDGIKLLSARNIRDGYLDFENVDYIGQAEHDRIKRRCNPVFGDVLISCSGTIGRVARVETKEPFSLVRSAALVRANENLVRSKFLEHYLRTPALKARMLRRANASGQANLFQGPIKELPVFLPPIPLQDEFARRQTLVEKSRSLQLVGSLELDALVASLQYRAFTGTL